MTKFRESNPFPGCDHHVPHHSFVSQSDATANERPRLQSKAPNRLSLQSDVHLG